MVEPGRATNQTLATQNMRIPFDTRIHAIDVHVHHLRAKLGDKAGRMIQTVRGFGYKFSPNTDELDTHVRT